MSTNRYQAERQHTVFWTIKVEVNTPTSALFFQPSAIIIACCPCTCKCIAVIVSAVTLSRTGPEICWHVTGEASGMYFSKNHCVSGFSTKLKDIPVAAIRLITSTSKPSWSKEPVLLRERLYGRLELREGAADTEQERDVARGAIERERPRDSTEE